MGALVATLILLASGVLAAHGQAGGEALTAEAQLELLRTLLPAEVGEFEFVMPAGDAEVILAPGSGDWVCRGDSSRGDRLGLTCYTRDLGPMLRRHRELQAQGVRGDAMRAQVDAEVRAGQLAMPAQGVELSMSGERRPDGEAPTEFDFYYLVYTPFATTASLAVPDVKPDDPTVPYLHHAGTHEAHVMWMKTVRLAGRRGGAPRSAANRNQNDEAPGP